MQNFNIFSQLDKDLKDFDTPIKIVGTSHKKAKPYMFSQGDTVGLIEYYTASKYETGDIDNEGQQKIFINNVSFRAEVASKQIDIDVSNFNFIPETYDSITGAIIERRMFRNWARDNYYSEQINDLVDRFPKYGTVVTKKVGNKIEVVPLRTLKNQQDAKDLKSSRYVIIEHESMTLDEMSEYPDWNTSGLDLEFGETTKVYEYYRKVPLDWFKKHNNEKVIAGDEDKVINALVILTIEKGKGKDEYNGRVLFCEKSDRPFEEAHYERQDGRWLGVGEVEKNFENQKARNMVENFRKKNLQWSGKKIFASTGDEISRNLVTEVKDGEVLNLGMSGQLVQVDTATRATGEFNTAVDSYEENANQHSFTYEVATGESLGSGVPFRLGVMMSNAVQSYYRLKREKLGLFLKRSYIEQIIPIFEKQNKKEQQILLSRTEEEYQDLQKAIKTYIANDIIIRSFVNDEEITNEMADIQADDILKNMPSVPLTIPDNFWDTIKKTVVLEITGEDIDVSKKMETLTNIFTVLSQKGDPRADDVLEMIMSLSGEKLPEVKAKLQPQQVGQASIPNKPQNEGSLAIPKQSNEEETAI